MPAIVCLPHDDPSSLYNYCPSLAPAILFAVLFGLITFSHVVQAFVYRHPAAWVLIMAGCWETGGYISRTISIFHQASSGIFTAQFLLILLAPLWINAFVYMILGRMMHFFLANDRIFGIRARRITLVFVLFDITAFVVQLIGGLMTSGTDLSPQTVQTGLNIYTGGVALQLAFIFVFICLSIRFRQALKQQDLARLNGTKSWATETPDSAAVEAGVFVVDSQDDLFANRTYSQAKPLLITLWIALSLIIVRNIFRLAEYAMGGVNGNTITRHEWYQYVFDAVLMFLAMVALSLFHPGRVLQGERSNFSAEDKARKTQKKAKKQEKADAKRARKEQKTYNKNSKNRALLGDDEASQSDN